MLKLKHYTFLKANKFQYRMLSSTDVKHQIFNIIHDFRCNSVILLLFIPNTILCSHNKGHKLTTYIIYKYVLF